MAIATIGIVFDGIELGENISKILNGETEAEDKDIATLFFEFVIYTKLAFFSLFMACTVLVLCGDGEQKNSHRLHSEYDQEGKAEIAKKWGKRFIISGIAFLVLGLGLYFLRNQ